MKEPKVALIMGSKSDKEYVKKASEVLDILGIPYTKNIFSAHRTPNELKDFIEQNVNTGSYEVVIAFAGMSAALAGVIASETLKPVIGVPLSGGKFHGVEALLSTIEMPPGIPVLSVGVDAANNAALAAARIISLNDHDVYTRLRDLTDIKAASVKEDNNTIEQEEW